MGLLERILGNFNRTMLTRRPDRNGCPGKEEVVKGDNAEVDWAGLVWIPDSFGYSYVIVDRCGQTPEVYRLACVRHGQYVTLNVKLSLSSFTFFTVSDS